MLQLWTTIYPQKPENEAKKSTFDKIRCPKLEARDFEIRVDTKLEMTSKITILPTVNFLRNSLSFPPNYLPQQ